MRDARQGVGLAIKNQSPMNDVQHDCTYLNQLQLSGKQLVGDKVVLDISVVVFEQVDSYERVDGRRSQRNHIGVPVWLTETRLARN